MLLMERIKRIDRWCDMLRSAGITLCFEKEQHSNCTLSVQELFWISCCF